MQPNLLTLRAVLARIDGESFDTLEGRITFQKRIYLVQVLGLDLAYRFAWNPYGPYSSELAQDGQLLEMGVVDSRDLTDELHFTDSAKQAISTFASLVVPPAGVTRAAWLEILSSLHYLASRVGGNSLPSDTVTRAEITEKLLSTKPYFRGQDEVIDEAWTRLDEALRTKVVTA